MKNLDPFVSRSNYGQRNYSQLRVVVREFNKGRKRRGAILSRFPMDGTNTFANGLPSIKVRRSLSGKFDSLLNKMMNWNLLDSFTVKPEYCHLFKRR